MISFFIVFIVSLLLAKLFSYFILKINKPVFRKRYLSAFLSLVYAILNYYIILIAILCLAMVIPNNLNQFDASLLVRSIILSSMICAVFFYKMLRKKT
ncbi:membrane hypothetical protein [Enterobacterales bacterium 8AC]|nr:membrane hypothetical protein [Enterobacterales bacterium 8AC]